MLFRSLNTFSTTTVQLHIDRFNAQLVHIANNNQRTVSSQEQRTIACSEWRALPSLLIIAIVGSLVEQSSSMLLQLDYGRIKHDYLFKNAIYIYPVCS